MAMQDEMTDEWLELATENIHKLIPQEWMPRINEILPKVLKIVKIAMKKNIKTSAEQLGDNKMFIMVNSPYILQDKSTIMVPTMYRIDKRQIGLSVLDEQTGNYEFGLKEGEQPEITFSMLTFIEKLDGYDKIEDLIKDIKNGTFMSLEDLKYTGDKSLETKSEQKQIEAPQTPNGE